MPKDLNINEYHKILSNISRRYYDVEIKRHAFIRAMGRGVDPDMIEATIKGGKIERFGKSYLRLIKRYKRFDVVCIGEICGLKIKILTVETRE